VCVWAVGWAISISEAYEISTKCTYMEKARAVLPIWAYWAEAFSTATHRTLTKALDGRTPYKMCDVKPDHADLHVLGALCAIVGANEKLKKL